MASFASDNRVPTGSTVGSGSDFAKRRARVCGAVVTYHPDERLPERLATLASQVDRLVVVDNGSATQEFVRRTVAALGGDAILNERNLGIGVALNQAAQFAVAADCDWMVTMDQDSMLHSDGLATLFATLEACPFRELVAVVGSAVEGERRRSGRCTPWVEERSVITSGSLVRLDALMAIGQFREDLFIDYVDHEFCLRLRRKGYRVIKSTRVTMAHDIGRPERRRFLWRHVTTSNHSALRRYYITRNRIVVWRSFLRSEPRFVVGDLISAVGKEMIKVLLETDRRRKLAAMLRGARDGLVGRLGPAPLTGALAEESARGH